MISDDSAALLATTERRSGSACRQYPDLRPTERDSPHHSAFRQWLDQLINSDNTYGLCDLVLSGFLRIPTHPMVFNPLSPMEQALTFVNLMHSQPTCTVINPDPRHWDIFCRLCRDAKVKGNLVPDAFLAAIAIESGSEWITTDREYHRFPDLRVRHPID